MENITHIMMKNIFLIVYWACENDEVDDDGENKDDGRINNNRNNNDNTIKYDAGKSVNVNDNNN